MYQEAIIPEIGVGVVEAFVTLHGNFSVVLTMCSMSSDLTCFKAMSVVCIVKSEFTSFSLICSDLRCFIAMTAVCCVAKHSAFGCLMSKLVPFNGLHRGQGRVGGRLASRTEGKHPQKQSKRLPKQHESKIDYSARACTRVACARAYHASPCV